MNITLRPELETLPARLKKLPLDERGYPVPWFVAWIDGKPEFRAADSTKFVRAIKEKRCYVCGDPLGVHLCFVAGPMCGINRTSAEPPCHYECARWSALNCPFLNNPQMVRREDEAINNEALREQGRGLPLARNPGVTLLWITKGYEVFDPGNGGRLITMGEPERVEWYREGRTATRAEVEESIASGLPSLEVAARSQPGAMAALERAIQRFERWLPNE